MHYLKDIRNLNKILTNCAPNNDGNIVLAEIEKCGPNALE